MDRSQVYLPLLHVLSSTIKLWIVQSFEPWAWLPQGNAPMSRHSGYPLGEQKGVDDYRCSKIKVNEHDCVNGVPVKSMLKAGLKGALKKECICCHNPPFPNMKWHE